MKAVYRNLQHLRINLGLSQNQFAEKLGTNVSNINRWENKNNGMSLETLYSISEKLNIPVWVLVSEKFDSEWLNEQTCRISSQEFSKEVKDLLNRTEIDSTKKETLNNILDMVCDSDKK